MEDVDGLDGGFALLLEAEHQVDPLAQRLGHLVRLQRLAVDEDEEARVVPGPRRQVHVVHPLAVLPDAEIETCGRGDDIVSVRRGYAARVMEKMSDSLSLQANLFMKRWSSDISVLEH